jgi:hypothetical protein
MIVIYLDVHFLNIHGAEIFPRFRCRIQVRFHHQTEIRPFDRDSCQNIGTQDGAIERRNKMIIDIVVEIIYC